MTPEPVTGQSVSFDAESQGESAQLASALAMHKPTAKEVVSAAGVNVLTHIPVPGDETLPTTAEFYDYAAKRNPAGHVYRCPVQVPEAVLAQIAQGALDAHRALRCSGYSRSDFLVTPEGEVFWLEANTLPGLSGHGNLATMASAAGMSYDELIQAILANAHRDGYRP